MKRILKKAYCSLLKIIPENLKDGYIYLTVNTLKKTDILSYAYNNMGILKWQNEEISGEKFVIQSVLRTKIPLKDSLVFFDVGANIGNYSKILSDIYPQSQIYAFEPNPNAFKILEKNINKNNTKIFQFGLGNDNFNEKIYTYKDYLHSGHASIFKGRKDVIDEEFSNKEIVYFDITIKTIDSFCIENNIEYIDLIKIDTEGYEYMVISGAEKLLRENRIGMIQFEFNDANILSRTFLKDYYDLLSSQYNFYRVDTKQLIPLGSYNSTNEIFKFQNILVIKKDIDKI